MTPILRNSIPAAAIALGVVALFVALEAVNTAGFATYGFPMALFVALWVLAFVLAWGAMWIVRVFRDGTRRPNLFGVLIGATLLVVVAVVWGVLVVDQMPCFMGVPNCD